MKLGVIGSYQNWSTKKKKQKGIFYMRRYISHITISQIRHMSKVNENSCYWIISKLEYLFMFASL